MQALIFWMKSLTTVILTLVGLEAAFSQLILPKFAQDSFNAIVQSTVDKFVTKNCNLSGTWTCTGAMCRPPPLATIRQEGYKLFFHNERPSEPELTGIWVRPDLLFVPGFDSAHGGDLGDVSDSCNRITWSDRGAIWDRSKGTK